METKPKMVPTVIAVKSLCVHVLRVCFVRSPWLYRETMRLYPDLILSNPSSTPG